jgi:hypothetical protein
MQEQRKICRLAETDRESRKNREIKIAKEMYFLLVFPDIIGQGTV